MAVQGKLGNRASSPSPLSLDDSPANKQAKYEGWDITALPGELVEQILVYANLDIKEVSACRLVSRSWRQLMDNFSMQARLVYRRGRTRLPFAHSQKNTEDDYLSIRNWLKCFSDRGSQSVERLDECFHGEYPHLREQLCYAVTAALGHTKFFHSRCIGTIHRDDAVVTICFSLDGNYFASASLDETVQIWGHLDGQWRPQTTIPCSGGIRRSAQADVTFSATNNYVACPLNEKTTQILECVDGQWQRKGTTRDIFCVQDFSFSPDGTHFAFVSRSKRNPVRVSRRIGNTWQEQSIISYVHGATAARGMGVVFSPDGRYLLVSFDNNTIRIFQCVDQLWLTPGVLHGQYSWLQKPSFSPDGKYFVAISRGEWMVIHMLMDDQWLLQWNTSGTGGVVRVCFNEHGDLIVCTRDGVYEIWELVDLEWKKKVRFPPVEHWLALRVSPDNTHFAMAFDANTVIIWALIDGELQERGRVRHSAKVWDISFSADGQHLITASADNTAKIWGHVGSRWWEKESIRHSDSVIQATFSPNGNYVLTAGETTTHLWMLQSRTEETPEGRSTTPV